MRAFKCVRAIVRSHSNHAGSTRRFSTSIRLTAEANTTTQLVQRLVKAAYYRGGTSRAVIINPKDLPADRTEWPSIFRQLMGAPDPFGRQLDGMGAGISSLSKICLVERYEKPHRTFERDMFIDYTFVGLGIQSDEVDVAGNCGNMSSAIGPYAYNAKLLYPGVYRQGDGPVSVMIRNTNTGAMIKSTFDVVGGQAAVQGNYAIDGVSGTGSRIQLDFLKPYGSKTGKVLPTGNKIDKIAGCKVTCVDGPNPAIFIRADQIGVNGTILPDDFNKLPEKLTLLEKIRKEAAVAMGIAATEDAVPRTIPKIGLVSGSSTHRVLSGAEVKSAQVDIVVRFLSDTQPHRAIPLTMALTTAIAARMPGTVVEQLVSPDPVSNDAITIGHASGRIQVNATMSEDGKTPECATVYRTAKRIFQGEAFYLAPPDTEAKHESAVKHQQGLGLSFIEDLLGDSFKQESPIPLKITRERTGSRRAKSRETYVHRNEETGASWTKLANDKDSGDEADQKKVP